MWLLNHRETISQLLVDAFMPDPVSHQLRFLEPRVDFFPKHEAQLAVK